MHDKQSKELNEVPGDLAIALVLGGIVFAILGIAWNVVAASIVAAVVVGSVFWLLNE